MVLLLYESLIARFYILSLHILCFDSFSFNIIYVAAISTIWKTYLLKNYFKKTQALIPAYLKNRLKVYITKRLSYDSLFAFANH